VSDLAHAAAILRAACGERVRSDFPMAPLTTFRVGGPAGLYLEPESDTDLSAAGRAVTEAGIPVVVLGRGSNVLVADEGFPGLVLRLGRSYRWSARAGDHLTAGGAMPLPAMAGVALRHSLAGLEFGVAIPGTLGGAVRMNAGAHGHEMAEVLDFVEVYRLREGAAVTLRAADAGFSYRRSSLGDDAVVIGARLGLDRADPAAIRGRMDEARAWRRATQPLAEPHCGSVFKNPPGDHAARLIEAAGAKGRRVGGASVSTKHANFIVTEPARASSADVVALIEEVRSLVEAHDGVRLESEVQLVGTFT
jgi:UDP-N-acetylmuramate dehydrogenase